MEENRCAFVLTLERIGCALLIVFALFLHLLRLRHAGPLWRDEVAVVNLTHMSWGKIFTEFPHEAFPPVFFGIIRAYTWLAGSSLFALRFYGWIVGMLCLVIFL